MVYKNDGVEMCEQVMNYVFIVRAKYLQLITAYLIFKEDTERVGKEFEKFNDHHNQTLCIYQKVVGETYTPGKVPSSELSKACQIKKKGAIQNFMPDVTQTLGTNVQTHDGCTDIQNLLENIGLMECYPKFTEEKIFIDILIDMDDADLEKIGIKQFGYRKRIIIAAREYKQQGL